MPTTTIAPERFRELAIEYLESALGAMQLEDGCIDDAIIGAELALMAIMASIGEMDPIPSLDPADLVNFLAEPECICPPDLVARGGFKGGCRAHG